MGGKDTPRRRSPTSSDERIPTGLTAPAGADVVPLWEILAASLLAVTAMAALLWHAYPGIRTRVRAVGDFEDPLEEPGAQARS